MKKIALYIFILLLYSSLLFSQISINTDGSAPANSAMLDVKSNNKGVLIPRMTFQQINAIQNPAEGLMVFCINCNIDGTGGISVYQNGLWKLINLNCYVPVPPVAGNHIASVTQIIWDWDTIPIALGYKWNTVNNYNTSTNLGTATSFTETGLTCWTNYTRYVWAYNACGPSQAQTLMKATSPIPFSPAPSAGTQVASSTQIGWNWNTVPGATGYKWSTTNNIATATDMGTYTSKTETGLTCGTAYVRYAWEFNGCGPSAALTMTKSTSDCWTCGNPFTIDHVLGNVAPVAKAVTYGTVTNIPGENSKCWITSNLGADHQAANANDATEASAGWYWQFNNMQGYMHDGTTRTPVTDWITDNNQNSDWTAANDPCTLELGTDWRIPTADEWNSVDTTGHWANYNGPWNSGLKMHNAGRLDYFYGSLGDRGTKGYYWSNVQTGLITWSKGMFFSASSCYIGQYQKSYGYSVRCISD